MHACDGVATVLLRLENGGCIRDRVLMKLLKPHEVPESPLSPFGAAPPKGGAYAARYRFVASCFQRCLYPKLAL